MIEVVKVKIRESGKTVYYNPRGLRFEIGENVIIEADRGVDYGTIASEVELLEKLEEKEPLKSVIRKADEKDNDKVIHNKAKAREAIMTCQVKVNEHKLPMKLVDADYSFDLSKLIFYFTSEGRVDFRELVKELAAIFKVRIELRQIGVRDEAKMFGGMGHCGRRLCCATFLPEFEPVTIKMAKQQNLSLNPTKISGVCGRLMCCLSYEQNTYQDCAKGMPMQGDRIKRGKDGKEGKVIDVNVLKRKATVLYEDGPVTLEFNNCCCGEKDRKCQLHTEYQFKVRKRKEDEEPKGGKPAANGNGNGDKLDDVVEEEKDIPVTKDEKPATGDNSHGQKQ